MFKILFFLGLTTGCLLGIEESVLFIDLNQTNMNTTTESRNQGDNNKVASPIQKKTNTQTLMYEFIAGEMAWKDAVNYCQDFNLNEYSDWILPSRKELLRILKRENVSTDYWSRTTFKSDNSFAWNANSKNSGWHQKNGRCSVLCIRYDDYNQLENGCRNGNPENCLLLGDYYIQNNNLEKSLESYKKACSLNEASACTIVGDLHKQGKGVKQDYLQASTYYKKACENDDKDACIHLSEVYQKGEGVEQNIYMSKYYFLLGIQEQNEADVEYSQISKPIMPKFSTITEKTQWITAQKKKIDQKYAQLEEKMAFCGKKLIVTMNDTKATIDQKFKNADKHFAEYNIEKQVFNELYLDYEQELDYIELQPNKTFLQIDKFANIYLSGSYNEFRYMVSWGYFFWEDVNSYKKYLENAYENIDKLKYQRKIKVLQGRYSESDLSPSERKILKKLIQSQNHSKQQELVNKFLKD